jgi:Na+-driven multidrug efflux pump
MIFYIKIQHLIYSSFWDKIYPIERCIQQKLFYQSHVDIFSIIFKRKYCFKGFFLFFLVFEIGFMALLIFLFAGYLPLIFTSDKEIVEMSTFSFKSLAGVIFFDGLQACGSAIMRSVGGQKYGILFEIIGFYIIGLPIGGYLMLKTSLSVRGLNTYFFCYFLSFLKTFIFVKVIGLA